MPLEMPDDTLDPTHAADPNPTTVVAGRVAPETTPAPDFQLSEDQNIVKAGGRTYVREEALHNERQARQKLSETLTKLEPLMPEFEEFLASKAGRNSATVHRASAAPAGDEASEDYSKDDLEGFAIVRGYYDQENKPDTRRAKSELDIMSRIGRRQAERVVAPVAENNTRDRAAANYAQAKSRQFVDGQPIADPQYVDAAFQSLPEEYRADPLIANITSVIAAGLEYLDMRKTGKVQRGRREPALREGGRGTVDRVAESLDALDLAAARARGKTPEQWAKLSKTVGDATGTVLEEV